MYAKIRQRCMLILFLIVQTKFGVKPNSIQKLTRDKDCLNLVKSTFIGHHIS